MNTIIGTFSENLKESEMYELRPTVKAVIVNEHHQVLLFGDLLIGGGIDKDETPEEALKRECLEEAGTLIEIDHYLGTVIQYRDALHKKYEVQGFLTHYIETMSKPTTLQEDELVKKLEWKTFDHAILFLKEKISLLENSNKASYETDQFQGGLYNAKTQLLFLEKAKEIIG